MKKREILLNRLVKNHRNLKNRSKSIKKHTISKIARHLCIDMIDVIAFDIVKDMNVEVTVE